MRLSIGGEVRGVSGFAWGGANEQLQKFWNVWDSRERVVLPR
ncbi:hypothetical protein RSSM_00062 [Rhodopirellula sallentina SM41]|uniref:Uncharacterized protein n=1 Tax=Rhodopirellula sallentina SM41 TaxID=1263870 RepID=M5UAT3_9BACT|nr:hypothetical protein RSSM_00062 [Rhodopirellula sallentina SM41]